MSKFEQYEHHGKTVWVSKELKGKHRDVCLCFSCKKLKINEKDNCPIAQETFKNCVKNDLVTPVFECPVFEEKE